MDAFASTSVRPGAESDSLGARLEGGLRSLGLEASREQQRKLLDFLTLLAKWNDVYNLTAIRGPADMLVLHVLDALSIVALVDRFEKGSILDVGSGAGIPAVPLAIIRPARSIHSVDAVGKKIGFQLQAKAALGLTNLHPVHTRVERLKLPNAPSIVVSRAFADIAGMLAAVEPLTDADTTVIAMKGLVPTDELQSLPAGWTVETIEPLTVPLLGAQRCAVVLRPAR